MTDLKRKVEDAMQTVLAFAAIRPRHALRFYT
jgi:hypothetical protein